mmetsp:Transcript_13690/g.23489  ORF Transcript_13690/g.23489 Transcript_13690/m.23489 type:complete len:297 (+) Transcript_13690:81-971(+)
MLAQAVRPLPFRHAFHSAVCRSFSQGAVLYCKPPKYVRSLTTAAYEPNSKSKWKFNRSTHSHDPSPFFRFGVPAGLLAAFILTAEAQAEDKGGITERSTGIVYPQFISDDSLRKQYLVGVGVRAMSPLKIKAYCIGLYVDVDQAKAPLAQWRGADAATLLHDHSFNQVLLQDRFDKSIRLVMARDVDGLHLAKGFDRSVIPRVRRAASSMNMPGGKEALKEFNGWFRGKNLKTGTEVVLHWHRGGKLTACIDGVVLGRLESPALCWALFDVYLGAKPVSSDAKNAIFNGFHTLLTK